MSRDFSVPFLSLLLLALTLAATTGTRASSIVHVRDNLVRLPFAKHVNLTGLNTLLERDRLRARAYALVPRTGPSPDAVGNVPIDNMLSIYVANVCTVFFTSHFNFLTKDEFRCTGQHWDAPHHVYVQPVTSQSSQGDTNAQTYGRLALSRYWQFQHLGRRRQGIHKNIVHT